MADVTSLDTPSTLLFHFQDGNRQVFNDLRRAIDFLIQRMAWKRCQQLGLNPSTYSEDVSQTIWELLLDPVRPRFDPAKGEVHRYLYGLSLTAVKKTRSEVKQHASQISIDDIAETNLVDRSPQNAVADQVEKLEVDQVVDVTIRGILGKCDGRDREIISRCALNGDPHNLVASETGVSTKTVQRRVHKFVKDIRQALPELRAA
jgi:DNA-directed RNA polymerase specialized sigma24 family protein